MTESKQLVQLRDSSIETTFMELIQELAELTHDDRLVIAGVRRIFDTHTVRLTRSLTPVKLVG